MAHHRYHVTGVKLAGALILVMAVGALAWWRFAPSGGSDANGLPEGAVSAGFVSARPDAHIVYPGARVFKTWTLSERLIAGGNGQPDPARSVAFMVTNDSAEMVRSWFASDLMNRGYGCYPGSGPDYALEFDTYHRGDRELLWVIYVNPPVLPLEYNFSAPSGRTVIEVDYLIRPESYPPMKFGSGPCYRPIPTPRIH